MQELLSKFLYFFLLFPFGVLANTAHVVHYDISDFESKIQVEMKIKSTAHPLEIHLPHEYAEVRDLEKDISDLSIVDEKNNIVSLLPSGKPYILKWNNFSHQNYSMRYIIKKNSLHPNSMRAILDEGNFVLIGSNSLAFPNISSDLINFSLCLKKNDESKKYGSSLALSIIKNQKLCSDVKTISEGSSFIRNILVAGGNFENHCNRNLCFLTDPKIHLSENFNQDATDFIQAVQSYFSLPDDHYQIVIQKTPQILKNEKMGISLEKGFLLLFPLNDNEDDEQIARRIFAHEYLHNWVGKKIAPADKSFYLNWFFEGITEYLSLSIARDNHFISEQAYLSTLNKHLILDHYLPHARATKKEIEKYALTDTFLGPVSYARGALFGLQLDALIRQKSQNKTTLADLIFSMPPGKYNQKNIEAYFIKYLKPLQLDTDYQKLKADLDSGKPFYLNINLSFNNLYIKTEPSKKRDFGLDLYHSLLENRIIGLTPNGPARNLGLKNNQKILSHNFAYEHVTNTQAVLEICVPGKKVELPIKTYMKNRPILMSLSSL